LLDITDLFVISDIGYAAVSEHSVLVLPIELHIYLELTPPQSLNMSHISEIYRSVARKKLKATGDESVSGARQFSYPEPFLRAVRRGALAKSITGYNKNMVRKQYPVLELANQMPVRIWIWPEPLVAPRVRRALGTRMERDSSPLTRSQDGGNGRAIFQR
jgi:hypothetical protein